MLDFLNNFRITSKMGNRIDPIKGKGTKEHRGTDIKHKSQKNGDVQAFLPGEVIFAREVPAGVRGTGYGGYGKVVAVRDKYGNVMLYGHMNKIDVKVGDRVSYGTVLGDQGTTGQSTGEHVHVELRKNGELYNCEEPFLYIIHYLKKEWGLAVDKARKDQIHKAAVVVKRFIGLPDDY